MCDRWRYVKNVEKNTELPKEFWLNFIPSLYGKIESICITGGEPLLYDGIKDVIQTSIENIKYVDFISNGEMLNDDFVNFFKSLTRTVSYHLSMDGNRETHDLIRKVPGSYDKIFHNANEMSTNERCFIRVNSVIRNENIDSLIDMIEGIKGWARFITLQHHSFIFDDYNYDEEMKLFGGMKTSAKHLPTNPLTGESILKLKELIKTVTEKYPGYVSFVPKLKINQIDDYYLNSSYKTPFEQCRHLYDTMRIKSDGSVSVCGWIYHKIGNLTKDTIEDIWNNDEMTKFRNIISTNNVDMCKRCCGLWN
jgi:MoaA/NifB/PqqE/SkfB family radical SAM enzyme